MYLDHISVKFRSLMLGFFARTQPSSTHVLQYYTVLCCTAAVDFYKLHAHENNPSKTNAEHYFFLPKTSQEHHNDSAIQERSAGIFFHAHAKVFFILDTKTPHSALQRSTFTRPFFRMCPAFLYLQMCPC